MKTLSTLVVLLLATTLSSIAQVDVKLQINHMLGNQTFQMNQTAQNDLTQDFQVTRMQYYVSRITVLHDGGQMLAISDDTVALMNANDGTSSLIDLGSLTVTAIEGVRFHIGVFDPVNNADPALYDSEHPLAPQSPSMHWGWSSGYRFLAMEGQGGTNFAQNFQLHGLGSVNYFEIEVMAPGQAITGGMVIAVDADYTRAVEGINVSSGVVSHGEIDEAQQALENFRDYVFSSSNQPVGTNEIKVEFAWAVYPNPSTDAVATNVVISEDVRGMSITVTNGLGQIIVSEELNGLTTYPLTLDNAGVYFVTLSRNGVVVATKTLTKN